MTLSRSARVLCAAVTMLASLAGSGALAAESSSAATPLGASVLPYQSPNKHMGVSTCSSSVCHGSVKSNGSYNVQLNEYITWSHEDTHAKAYSVLLNDRSRAMAAKLGLADAHTAKICLDCHADNVPQAARGKEFNITDGIGCEACHGGAENWLETHTAKTSTYAQNLKRGMFPTADVGPRAALCISCHVGNSDKLATHRIMGAGHPRLSFELDTFQALQPPHHTIDKDYIDRKGPYSRTRFWAYGQVESARAQVQLIQQHFTRNGAAFPELALFSCHACHESSMRRLDWARGLTTVGNAPGSVPLNDGNLRMAVIVARQLDATTARDLLSLAQMLQEASGESRERVSQLTGRLDASLREFETLLANHKWNATEQGGLVAGILDLGARREFRDYISAEQAMMALDLILIDLGKGDRYRAKLDMLYKLVEDDEAYRADQFASGLDQLRASMGLSPSAPPAASGPGRLQSAPLPGAGFAPPAGR